MKYLSKQALIWIGDYFPEVPRFFGLKILKINYTDITSDIGSGSRPNGKMQESKVSWLVKNDSLSPLPVKIIMSCVLAKDAWAQVYPINQDLMSSFNRDVSCGEEKFDSELGQKRKSTIVPPQGLLKIDHYSLLHPHPSCLSDEAFKIVPEDPSVIVRRGDLLNHKGAKRWLRCMRFGIGVAGLAIIVCIAMYFWVQIVVPVKQHFLS